MKYRKFSDVKGKTPIDKLNLLLSESSDGIVIAQVKENGVHCIVSCGTMSSREKHTYPESSIPAFMEPVIKVSYDNHLIIHGELVSRTCSFQELCGRISVNANKQDWTDVFLRIFDVGFPDRSLPYRTRLTKLYQLLPINYEPRPIFSIAQTSAEALDLFYEGAIEDGREGVIYRLSPCIYDPSLAVHPDIIKRKRLRSMEGVCIAVYEGKGKRVGLLGSMMLRLDNKQYVLVGGGKGMDDAMLKRLLTNPPIDKRVTFTFEDMSTSGTPLRPQFVCVRDYE